MSRSHFFSSLSGQGEPGVLRYHARFLPVREGDLDRGGKPRTEVSLNREMALIFHMLSKAVEWGFLKTSPFKKGKKLMLKETNLGLRFLLGEEAEKLLSSCSSNLKPIVEVALLTGMRRGELLGKRQGPPNSH